MATTSGVDPAETVMDLILGRWRSQTLYAGVELGPFEEEHGYAPGHPMSVVEGRVG